MADIALAGRVIASHYAAPVEWVVVTPVRLRARPSEDGEAVAQLNADDKFLMLDDSLGWAWGYGGPDRLVGYVPTNSLKR